MITAACNQASTSTPSITKSGIDHEKFISEYNGKPTALYTLENANGMEACITNFGGRIVSLMVPGRDGELRDVVLGFDSIAAYFPENNQTDFSAAIGRYANRINQGRFVIDGDTIQLPTNNFGHCLHGGPTGWQYQVYEGEQPNDSTVVLTMHSPDGDNNFPGNVTAKVTYTLTSDNRLDIAYEAVTDKPTVINMTNHAYFNLNGDPSKPITDNELYVNATNFTPVDSTYMTTGEIIPVTGTPMDFTGFRLIGERINETDYEQIRNGNGYDHNWVLDTNGDVTVSAATLDHPRQALCSMFSLTSPASRSIPATSSTEQSPARATRSTTSAQASALRHSTTPTAPTSQNGPRLSSVPARLTRATPSSLSQPTIKPLH